MPSYPKPIPIPFPLTADDDDDDDADDITLGTGRQCLPMATLDQGFNGVPTNGEQYLAMMHKQSRSLPWITSAPNPYRATHFTKEQQQPPPPSASTTGSGFTSHTSSAGDGKAKQRLHPSLPTESWQQSFDAHFRNYRKYIQDNKSRMPKMSLEDIPHPSNQSYINGVKRKRIHKSKISLYPEIAAAAVKAQQTVNSDERRVEDDLADSLEDVGRTKQQQEGVVPAEVESVTEVQVQVVQEFVRDVNEEEELMNEEEEMMNEEEAMNEEEYYGNEGDDDDGEEEEFEDEDENDDDDEEDDENGQVDEEKYFFEPEQPKHRGQEPTLPLIAAFSQWRLHKTLAYLDTWISETLDIVSAELTSTTETDEINPAAPLSNSTAAAATPLTPRYARWIFSCLLFLDEYLSADQMSDLRNLAKTCVKIVIWQVATGRVGPDGQGVDERQEEMRVNAWIVHRAICGGWAQHDLLQDAESMLGQLA